MNIPLKDFKIDASRARNIAERLWGGGGTKSDRTNRQGVYYYSCSGHGGYIVDPSALTAEEKESIDSFIKEYSSHEGQEVNDVTSQDYYVNLCVQDKPEPYVIGVRNPYTRGKSVMYSTCFPTPYWSQYYFYVFEEDCDWAILENFTDIRTAYSQNIIKTNPEKLEEYQKAIANTIENIKGYAERRKERALESC